MDHVAETTQSFPDCRHCGSQGCIQGVRISMRWQLRVPRWTCHVTTRITHRNWHLSLTTLATKGIPLSPTPQLAPLSLSHTHLIAHCDGVKVLGLQSARIHAGAAMDHARGSGKRLLPNTSESLSMDPDVSAASLCFHSLCFAFLLGDCAWMFLLMDELPRCEMREFVAES
jgi:hypothetical protein